MPGNLDCVVSVRGNAGTAAAEAALTNALAAMKSAEGAFDAASDRCEAAERALDAFREDRA